MKPAQTRRKTRAAKEPRGTHRSASRRSRTKTKSHTLQERDDIILAKQTPPSQRKPKRKRPAAKPKASGGSGSSGSTGTGTAKKGMQLSELLSPKNIQESIKSVNNIRGMVKNGLRYLQQADQMLDTFYVTSNSLRETGILDKLVKSRGKNLTTEDFTSILAALMSSPIGGQLFKGMGSGESQSAADAAPQPTASPNAPTPGPGRPPGAPE